MIYCIFTNFFPNFTPFLIKNQHKKSIFYPLYPKKTPFSIKKKKKINLGVKGNKKNIFLQPNCKVRNLYFERESGENPGQYPLL